MSNKEPGSHSRRDNLIDAVIVVAACAIFLGLCVYQLDLPGLYYDEAWDAVSTMHILQGKPTELDLGANINIFGRQWQLMLNSYQGIISTYLLLPFFALFGPSVYSIRAMPIMAGVIAIILLYFLTRAWFGRGTARLAVLMLAVSPSWVFWSRLGVYVVSEIVPFTLGALLAFTTWWRSRKNSYGALFIGFFLLGIGMATKLLYLWPIIAIIACFVVLNGRRVWLNRSKGLRMLRPAWSAGLAAPRQIRLSLAGAVGSFCIGSFTFLAYNFQTQGTWKKIKTSFFQTDYGANNSTVLPNLHEQLDRFKVLMDGGYFWFQAWDGKVLWTNNWMPPAFYLAAFGLLFGVAVAQPWTPGKNTRPWLLLILAFFPLFCMLLASYASPTDRRLILLIPGLLAVLLAAGAGVWLLHRGLRQPERWARPAALIMLAATLLSGITWWRNGAPDDQVLHGLDLRLGDLPGVSFWLSLVGLVTLLGWGEPKTRLQRPVVMVVTFMAAILGQSFSTLSGLWPTHLLVMIPFPQLLVAAGIVALPRALTQVLPTAMPRWVGIGVATLAAATLLSSDINADYSFHRDLQRTGGYFAFSDGIYDLADYVQKEQPRPVVAVEWGIRRQIQILSQGTIEPAEIYQFQFGDAPPEFYRAVDATLQNPETLYIFTAPGIGPYLRFDAFTKYLDEKGLEPILLHSSLMRDSKPIYEVYGIRRKQ